MAKLSTDTDGGIVKNTKGTVVDYTGCFGSSCIFNSYTDYCINTDDLREYRTNGAGYLSSVIDCSAVNYHFCGNPDTNNVYLKDYRCSGGECDLGNNVFVQTCTASPISYGTWSCQDINTKVRTVTTYSPVCSLGVCSQTSSTSSGTQNCLSSQYCNSGSCDTITYHWNYGSWGSCTGNCGSSSGTESRTSTCIRDYDGATVSSSYCGVPADSQSCTKTAYPNSWTTGGWGSCSVSCGPGTETRSVWCSGSCCNPSTKPSTSQGCNLGSCETYHWNYGSWDSCAGTCGSTSGTQSRTSTCIRDSDSAVVSNSYCGTPTTSQSCIKVAYPTSWSLGSWSACSPSCGASGTQTRSVSCSDCCNPSTKPATSQTCNGGSCCVPEQGNSCQYAEPACTFEVSGIGYKATYAACQSGCIANGYTYVEAYCPPTPGCICCGHCRCSNTCTSYTWGTIDCDGRCK